MEGVAIEKIVKKLELKKLTEEMDLTGHRIVLSDVNRPALQLSGYFEHFEATRLQIIGFVEYTYMEGLEPERKREVFEALLNHNIPAIVFCRELQPDPLFLEIARAHQIPILMTKKRSCRVRLMMLRSSQLWHSS